MQAFHTALPLWFRAVLLAGVFCLVAGAGLISYRLYVQPTTLTIAVGSFDGEAKQIASVIAGRLATVQSADRKESAPETLALMSAAHRIDNLIHHRRAVLAAKAPVTGL
jgi:hypothetical protein